jgi:hypothetical protein
MVQTHQARRLFRIQGVPIMGKEPRLIEENRKLTEENRKLTEENRKLTKLNTNLTEENRRLTETDMVYLRQYYKKKLDKLQKKCDAELLQLRIYHAGYQQALRLLEGDYQGMDKQLLRQLKDLFGVDLQVTQ